MKHIWAISTFIEGIFVLIDVYNNDIRITTVGAFLFSAICYWGHRIEDCIEEQK